MTLSKANRDHQLGDEKVTLNHLVDLDLVLLMAEIPFPTTWDGAESLKIMG